MVESAGIHCDPRAAVTPEQLADQWPQITELREPKAYFDAVEQLRAVMAKE